MATRWTWALLVWIGMLSTATTIRGADDSAAEDLYYKAWHAETGERDLGKAVALYQEVIDKHQDEVAVVAKAQLQLGACYEKLGDFDQAKAAYQKLIERFESQRELVEKAKARLSALDATKIDPGAKKAPVSPPLAEGVQAAIENKLKTTVLDIDFSDTPISEVVDFLRDFAGLNIILDGGHLDLDKLPKVTFTTKGLTLQANLKLICGMCQAVYVVREGAIVITTREGADYFAARDAEREHEKAAGEDAAKSVRDRIAQMRISVSFNDASLDDILSFLREMGGFNIVLAPGAASQTKVSFKVADLSFGRTLDLLCDTTGLTYEITADGVILIRKPATEAGK